MNPSIRFGRPLKDADIPGTTALERAQWLTERGYRRTSSNHHIVVRIDKPDWLKHLALHLDRKTQALLSPNTGEPELQWCDFYRRVISQDRLRIESEQVFKAVPASSFDATGFVALVA